MSEELLSVAPVFQQEPRGRLALSLQWKTLQLERPVWLQVMPPLQSVLVGQRALEEPDVPA